MTPNKRMRLESIREKLLETYRETYYEIVSFDKKNEVEAYRQYNLGKLVGLSQALIYLGIPSNRLDSIKIEMRTIVNQK